MASQIRKARTGRFYRLALSLKTGNGSRNVLMPRDSSRNGKRDSSSTAGFLGHVDETKLDER